MSDQQKRELVDQIAWLVLAADENSDIIFAAEVDSDASHKAGFFINDFFTILDEYRATLSVPQVIRNTGHTIILGEIEKHYPDLAREVRACSYKNRIIGDILSAKSDEVAANTIKNAIAAEEAFLKEDFAERASFIKSQACILPKGIESDDVHTICDDIHLLLECQRKTWVHIYGDEDENTKPEDRRTDNDHLGLHGSMQWLINMVESVRALTNKGATSINAECVPKVGPGHFKPPSALLN